MASNWKKEPLDEEGLPSAKTTDSLIERCKQSGLALRKYLYCMEATESSSDEDDYYKQESPNDGVCSAPKLLDHDFCRPRLCGRSRSGRPLSHTKRNEKSDIFSQPDLEEQSLLQDDTLQSGLDKTVVSSWLPQKNKNLSLKKKRSTSVQDADASDTEENKHSMFHNYFPSVDRTDSYDTSDTENKGRVCAMDKDQGISAKSKTENSTLKRMFRLNLDSSSSDNNVFSSYEEKPKGIPGSTYSKCSHKYDHCCEPSSRSRNKSLRNRSNRGLCHSSRNGENQNWLDRDTIDTYQDKYGVDAYKDRDDDYSDGNNVDVDQFESLLDYSPSGYMSSLARIDLGNKTPDNEGQTNGYSHALPYLSDRLRTNLVQRLGLGADSIGEDKGDEVDQASAMWREELPNLDEGRELSDDMSEGRQLNADSGNLTDERTLSDLLFDLHKIDMIDRVFLTENDESEVGPNPHKCCSRHVDEDDSDNEADDEFDCECQFCLDSRSGQRSDANNPVLTGRTEPLEPDPTGQDSIFLDSWLLDDDSSHTITSIRLPPLEVLIQERRADLERMFETVIMQMLAVYPDLLTDMAPPPASPSTIDSLVIAPPTRQQIDQRFSCSICLCVYEESDTVTSLPCQHLFHPLCIQAWLSKSGTCPVCRFILE